MLCSFCLSSVICVMWALQCHVVIRGISSSSFYKLNNKRIFGCDTVYSGKCVPKFQRNPLPVSWSWWCSKHVPQNLRTFDTSLPQNKHSHGSQQSHLRCVSLCCMSIVSYAHNFREGYFRLRSIQTDYGAHTAPCSIGIEGSFAGIKLAEREAGHSATSRAKVKNSYSCTCIAACAFVTSRGTTVRVFDTTVVWRRFSRLDY